MSLSPPTVIPDFLPIHEPSQLDETLHPYAFLFSTICDFPMWRLAETDLHHHSIHHYFTHEQFIQRLLKPCVRKSQPFHSLPSYLNLEIDMTEKISHYYPSVCRNELFPPTLITPELSNELQTRWQIRPKTKATLISLGFLMHYIRTLRDEELKPSITAVTLGTMTDIARGCMKETRLQMANAMVLIAQAEGQLRVALSEGSNFPTYDQWWEGVMTSKRLHHFSSVIMSVLLGWLESLDEWGKLDPLLMMSDEVDICARWRTLQAKNSQLQSLCTFYRSHWEGGAFWHNPSPSQSKVREQALTFLHDWYEREMQQVKADTVLREKQLYEQKQKEQQNRFQSNFVVLPSSLKRKVPPLSPSRPTPHQQTTLEGERVSYPEVKKKKKVKSQVKEHPFSCRIVITPPPSSSFSSSSVSPYQPFVYSTAPASSSSPCPPPSAPVQP
jgi:hypothetical protein